VDAGTDERKAQFAQHLVSYIPLAAHIKRVLDERSSHRAPIIRFHDELEDSMSEEEAETTLQTVINWARYAEVLAFDGETGMISLDNPS
jgi:NitT/TauT family transport system ATP-binding protein